MDSTYTWQGKLDVPDSLRRGHDDVRAELVRATMEGGQIAKAGRHVAELCLPHFDHEEKCIFPVLALLPHLVAKNPQPEMMEVMPTILSFRANHDALNDHHQSIVAAIEGLLQAAQKAKNREFANPAYHLRIHERIEDDVIYPTIMQIGNYLQERFAH